MKRVLTLVFTLALCLCAAQLVISQQKQSQPVQQLRCIDCDPTPEPTPTPTPGCTSPNPIDDATFFVSQQYRDFLFREPTGGELIDDLPPLNSCLHNGDFACYNTERVKMSRRMWDKAEFRQQSRTFGLPLYPDPNLPSEHYNDDDFVSLEYWIYLQRAPDTSGYNFWLGNLNSCVGSHDFAGADQCYNDTINAFLSSTEYRSRFGCP
jgi:hypothetical protein